MWGGPATEAGTPPPAGSATGVSEGVAGGPTEPGAPCRRGRVGARGRSDLRALGAPSSGPIAPPEIRTSPGGARYWNDPSVDPKALERAYASPQRPLPAQARPKPSAIVPPKEAEDQMKRDPDAIPY